MKRLLDLPARWRVAGSIVVFALLAFGTAAGASSTR
jgi:hypothetical protein